MNTPNTPSSEAAELLDEVRDTLAAAARLDERDAGTAALWVAATHAADCWAHAPRLLVTVERGGWRFRLMESLHGLTRNPMVTELASQMTILRAVDGRDRRGMTTLLVHSWPTPRRATEVWALLGAGFHREAVTQVYNATTGQVERLSNFAMAAIFGPVPDYVADQGVPVILRPTAVAGYRPRRRAWHEVKDLRRRLAAQTNDQFIGLLTATPHSPLTGRPADIWAPLLAVADAAGGHWPATARTTALAITKETNG